MVKITVESTDGAIKNTVLAKEDGSWSASAPAGKSYLVTAEAFSYLSAKTASFPVTADKMLPANQLKGGDINGDGFANISDITGVVSNFGKAAPQPWVIPSSVPSPTPTPLP